MMDAQNQPSPAELIQQIRRDYNLTWDGLGDAMGRSGRMMRKIARGETSGESYRQALVELQTTGQVQNTPARRKGKDGQLVKVRAKHGAAEKSVTPRLKTPRPGSKRAGAGHSLHTQYLPDGNKIETVTIPRTRNAQVREAGVNELRSRIINIARSTSHRDKRVRISATVDIGRGRTRVVEVGSKGGYLVNDVVSDVRKLNAGNMPDWLNSQMGHRYVEELGSNAQVVSVTVTTFNASRDKAERVRQDVAGTRRWNRRQDGRRW